MATHRGSFIPSQSPQTHLGSHRSAVSPLLTHAAVPDLLVTFLTGRPSLLWQAQAPSSRLSPCMPQSLTTLCPCHPRSPVAGSAGWIQMSAFPPWNPFLLSPPLGLVMFCPSCDLCGLGDVLFLPSQMLPTPLSSQISSKINNRTVHSSSFYVFWPKDPRAPSWLVFNLSVPALGNSTAERASGTLILCP